MQCRDGVALFFFQPVRLMNPHDKLLYMTHSKHYTSTQTHTYIYDSSQASKSAAMQRRPARRVKKGPRQTGTCRHRSEKTLALLQAGLVCLDRVGNGLQDALVVGGAERGARGPAHLHHQRVAFVLWTQFGGICADCLAVFVA